MNIDILMGFLNLGKQKEKHKNDLDLLSWLCYNRDQEQVFGDRT